MIVLLFITDDLWEMRHGGGDVNATREEENVILLVPAAASSAPPASSAVLPGMASTEAAVLCADAYIGEDESQTHDLYNMEDPHAAALCCTG